jgi:hypothetical protein
MDVSRVVRELEGRTDGRFFSVTFIKRTTGEIRKMNCRLHVLRHLKGVGSTYDPKAHDLMVVWDIGKKGYRSIPLENVLSATIDGRKYE